MGVGAPRAPSQPPAQMSASPGTWIPWSLSGRSLGSSQICTGCAGEWRGVPREGAGAPSALPHVYPGCWAAGSVLRWARGGRPQPDPSPSRTPPEAGSLRRPGRTKARMTSWETWCCGCRCVGWGGRPGRQSEGGLRGARGKASGFTWSRAWGLPPSPPCPHALPAGPSGPTLPGGSVVPAGALH